MGFKSAKQRKCVMGILNSSQGCGLHVGQKKAVDKGVRAKTVFPNTVTGRRKWIKHGTNRSDVEGIDTPPSKKAKPSRLISTMPTMFKAAAKAAPLIKVGAATAGAAAITYGAETIIKKIRSAR